MFESATCAVVPSPQLIDAVHDCPASGSLKFPLTDTGWPSDGLGQFPQPKSVTDGVVLVTVTVPQSPFWHCTPAADAMIAVVPADKARAFPLGSMLMIDELAACHCTAGSASPPPPPPPAAHTTT